VIEGTNARQGVLDPLGADVKPGPEAYQQVLTQLSKSLRDCLAG
jgi:zinc transport system substrate-binding protein